MAKMTPFGGKDYGKNSDKCRYGETPCAYCGKAVKGKWRLAVRVRTDGQFAAQDADIPESLDQGCFPVGSDCAKKLAADGVPVFNWNG